MSSGETSREKAYPVTTVLQPYKGTFTDEVILMYEQLAKDLLGVCCSRVRLFTGERPRKLAQCLPSNAKMQRRMIGRVTGSGLRVAVAGACAHVEDGVTRAMDIILAHAEFIVHNRPAVRLWCRLSVQLWRMTLIAAFNDNRDVLRLTEVTQPLSQLYVFTVIDAERWCTAVGKRLFWCDSSGTVSFGKNGQKDLEETSTGKDKGRTLPRYRTGGDFSKECGEGQVPRLWAA